MKSIKNIYIFESPDNGKTVYKRLFDDEINLITFSLIISLLFLCIGIMRFYFQVYLFKFSQNISISTKEKIIENFFYTNFKTQNELSKSKIYNYLGLYVDRFTEASLSVMNFINNNLLILGTMLLVFSINYTSLIIIFFLSLVLYLLYFFIKNFVNKYSVLEEKNSRKINKEINKIVFSFKDFILLNQSELIIAKVKNYLFALCTRCQLHSATYLDAPATICTQEVNFSMV